MSHGVWTATAIVLALLLVVAVGIVIVGYAAYDARRAKEAARRRGEAAGPDPVEELAATNDALAERLGQARRSLESTREAVRDGVRW